MKLFCLTYAGGTAAFYDDLEKNIGFIAPEINLIKIEYAGHGDRRKEPFYESFNQLADDVLEIIKNELKMETYALMGYSMGSISVAVILQRMINEGCRLPSNIFLAAHEPKTKKELQGFSQSEMDEYVKDRTIRFGGVPEVLLNNKAFWRVYLPLYRNDYGMIGKFDFDSLDFYSAIPTTVFFSETDTPYIEISEWNRFFKNCEYKQFEGTHFFINNWCKEIAEIICEKMKKAA